MDYSGISFRCQTGEHEICQTSEHCMCVCHRTFCPLCDKALDLHHDDKECLAYSEMVTRYNNIR